MQRINIVGCPGAGKSTLARKLSERTGLPVYHLDKVYHSASHPYEDRPRWDARIDEIIAKPSWIIDGVHQTTYERRFSNGDLTIFLDFPLWLCLWRIFKRWATNINGTRPDMPPEWRERIGINFVLFVLKYPFNQRPPVYRALERYAKGRFVVCHNPREVQQLLQQFGAAAEHSQVLGSTAK